MLPITLPPHTNRITRRFSRLASFCLMVLLLMASRAAHSSSALHYTLEWGAPHEKFFTVSLRTAKAAGTYTDFKMPAWRPGRYMLQNYAAGVSHFVASDAEGNKLQAHKVDKDTWRVSNPKGSEVRISYRWHCGSLDAGSSYIDRELVYFNGSNLLMYVPGRLDSSCTLETPQLTSEWKIASGLTQGRKLGQFSAATYHDLIDCPTIFSPKLKQFTRQAGNCKLHVHFWGKYEASSEKAFLDKLEAIALEQAAIFGGFPFSDYHFIYLLAPFRMRHAVEHMNSAMFVMPEATAANDAALNGLLPISSHEFWHVWNVKRIRPAALWPYDYSHEIPTSLHWFTEGCTEYYTSLALVRAGIMTTEEYVADIAGDIRALENSYGAKNISPSQSSQDSWHATSPYWPEHLRTSFYSLGVRVGLLLDLKLRAQTEGKKGFDDVFAYLYANYYQKNLGVPENGIQLACETLSGQSWQDFFDNYVHGTTPIPYNDFLKPFGLKLTMEPDASLSAADRVGLPGFERNGVGYTVTQVRYGSDAWATGLQSGDVIISINGKRTLDQATADLFANVKPGTKLKLLVKQGKTEHNLEMDVQLRMTPQTVKIEGAEGNKNPLFKAWLESRVPKGKK